VVKSETTFIPRIFFRSFCKSFVLALAFWNKKKSPVDPEFLNFLKATDQYFIASEHDTEEVEGNLEEIGLIVMA